MNKPNAFCEGLESMNRMSRDLAKAGTLMSVQEVRFLVKSYYARQEERMREDRRAKALSASNTPNNVIDWLSDQSEVLEKQIARAIEKYIQVHPLWNLFLEEVYGIGPIISAGLLSTIDITRAPTVGHIWSYAGLDPKVVWLPGEERPWNGLLKTVCWKAGQSFMKFASNKKCVYGHIYHRRKTFELERNDSGRNKDLAVSELTKKKYGKDTDAYLYTSGNWVNEPRLNPQLKKNEVLPLFPKLPPAQIDARARRYAVKQFLADLHYFWYRYHFKIEPPKPYPIAILGHAHYRQPGTEG